MTFGKALHKLKLVLENMDKMSITNTRDYILLIDSKKLVKEVIAALEPVQDVFADVPVEKMYTVCWDD